ncbi:hydrolase [Lederbergia lenta]|nr:hydrolase [Lederbergia lenta]MCM3113432.1 hydrolase [Lederbergia lenta]MEC2326423.1 hydrolase [Lederbergia lenta]
MRLKKNTYYIAIGSGEIMSTPTASPWQFKIEATDEEIKNLRALFDSSADNSVADFLRAHIPYRDYHRDPTNDIYDQNLFRAYETVHQLGDEEARSHIESMGILTDFTSE